MEEKKKIKLVVIISIIVVIAILALIGILYTNNVKLKKLNNEMNEIKGVNKKAITSEEFKNIILTKGFNVNTVDEVLTDEVIKKVGIKKGYITRNIEDKEYRINFYEHEDENSEQYWFYDGIFDVRNEGNWNITETIEKSMNHTKYTALTNGNYIVISRIGNTLIWATINADKKQELIDLLDEFGY